MVNIGKIFDGMADERQQHWEWCYLQGNGSAAKSRRPWFKDDLSSYPTDRWIDGCTDRELLEFMGVPLAFQRQYWGDSMPTGVLDWVTVLPWAQRPSYEAQDQRPELFGRGLVLYGPPNTGKSTLAAELLLRLVRAKFRDTDPTLHNRGWHGAMTGRWFDWQECSQTFRQAARGAEEDAAADELEQTMLGGGKGVAAVWMVLDDLSRERTTEFNIGVLQRILRHRGNKGLTTILTTNTPPSEWEQVYGAVLSSYMERQSVCVRVTR